MLNFLAQAIFIAIKLLGYYQAVMIQKLKLKLFCGVAIIHLI